ncbi:hypothetical protein [Bradyrhizobium mercantei]|uniref:hypothetical protein n=1 Tax=Bradyrhizobium mercantei TaxID=1904807 RepID=UPI0011773ED5|nr:hypothetical protein [Bradyrhizobium mercantei]
MDITSVIRGFSCWLRDENKPGIMVRPHDGSLDEDAQLYSLTRGGRNIVNALTHLRNFLVSARAPEILAHRLTAFPEDAALIRAAADAAKSDIAKGAPWPGFEKPDDVNKISSALRGFSMWLQTNKEPAIAGRLNDQSLLDDGRRYRRARKTYSLSNGLNLLWKYDSLRPPSAISDDLDLVELLEREMEVDGPPSEAGDVGSKDTLLPVSPAATIEDDDLDLLELLEREIEVEEPPSAAGEGTAQEASLQASPAAAAKGGVDSKLRMQLARLEKEMEMEMEADGQSSFSLEGDPWLASFQESLEVLAAPETSLELAGSILPYSDDGLDFDTVSRDEAHDSRASGELGQPQQSYHPATAITAQAPAHDFAPFVGANFNHGPQPAPDLLIGELNRRGMLPLSIQQPTNLVIHGQSYVAVLGPGMREVTHNNPFSVNIMLRPRLLGG